jgi:hypothetical protein
MCIFKKPLKKDWIPIETITAKYITEHKNDDGYKIRDDDKHVTFYHIQYSRLRNEFRLEIEGYDADCNREEKIKAIERLSELNRLLLSNKIEDFINNKD